MKNQTWRKVHNILLILMTTVIFIGGGYLYFIYLIDGSYYNPIFGKFNPEVVLEKTEYRMGEDIYGTWEYCLNRKLIYPTIKTWSFVDSLIYSLPTDSAITTNELGCFKKKLLITPVPYNLPSGDYYMTGTLTFKVNSVKSIMYERYTTKFKIIK